MLCRNGRANCAIRPLLRRLAENAIDVREALARHGAWRIAVPALLAAVTLAAFVNALAVAAHLAQTSDSANGFVVGHAIAGGNVFLTGWNFPLDDYYFTEAVPYAFLEWLTGPRPFLLVLVPALAYALFVLVALLACVRRERPPVTNLQGVAAVALLLAAPAWIGQWDPVLLSDMHMTTMLGAFVALVLCARIADEAGARPAGAAAGLAVIICATVASDPFALVFAFGPALAILAGEMAMRRGTRGLRLAFLLVAAGMLAGWLLPQAIAQSGGFTTENDILAGPQTLALLPRNFIAVATGTLTLFGANPLGIGTGFRDVVLLALRAIGFVLAAGAVLRAMRIFLRGRPDLLGRMLCAGILITILACATSAQFAKGITSQILWTGGPPMRFLVPAWLFAAVLAGRQVPDILSALRSAWIRNAACITLVLLAATAMLGDDWLSRLAARPLWIANNPPAAVARWLRQHHLFQGVGEYWSANLVTAMSGNAVQVRSVVPDSGHLAAYIWVEDARWYAQAPQFVIWQDNNKTGVTPQAVRATYPVDRIVTVADYRVALLSARGRRSPPQFIRAR